MSAAAGPWAAPAPADAARHDPGTVFEAGERNHHVSNTAYPIAHRQTWAPYRVARERQAQTIASAWQGIEELCLYVHIPFCESRCGFCEYTVVGPGELPQARRYMDDLGLELELYRALLGTERRTLRGFDFGGGTPSQVPAERVAELIEHARAAFTFAPGLEISIETTPKIAAAEPEKLTAYRHAGIGRISMGVQVVEPELLSALGRAGNGAEVHLAAVDNIRGAGFSKLNLDLMYGFARQSLEGWRATLEHALSLDPESVTLYRMRYKLTRLAREAGEVSLGQVRAQAALAHRVLQAAGYLANPGKNTYSRVPGDPGTSDYLTRRVVEGMPYLGLGAGAQSFSHTTLSYNEGAAGKSLTPYFARLDAGELPVQDLYHLPIEQAAAKMVAVSFYFGGIDRRAFQAKFTRSLDELYPRELRFVLERGLMENDGQTLRLTPEGARHFPGVIALFFSPSVQDHLVRREPERPAAGTDFANVLFAGPCNRRCPYCVGERLPARVNQSNLELFPLRGIEAFIAEVNRRGIDRIVFTGTVSDPQLYLHEAELLALFRDRIHTGASYQVHTNGVLALEKLETFNLYDSACISLPSFDPDTYEKHTGSREVPDLGEILRRATIPVKVSCVLDEHNLPELPDFLARCQSLGVRRVVLRRQLGEARHFQVLEGVPIRSRFRGNPVYDLGGMEVTYWEFETASATSINLFADGTLGTSYLLTETPELARATPLAGSIS